MPHNEGAEATAVAAPASADVQAAASTHGVETASSKAKRTGNVTLTSVKSLSDPSLVADLASEEEDLKDDDDDEVTREAEDVDLPSSSSGTKSEDSARASKAKTLPHKLAGLGFNKPNRPSLGRLANLKNTQSLKRSITMPKNPFKSDPPSRDASPRGRNAAAGNAAGSNFARTQSVRNFFNRVVSNMPPLKASARKLQEAENERIAEAKRRFEREGKVPGVIGIRNHGNTCFINAILQCLSYTDLLAEYFVLDGYKSDLRRKRRIASSITNFSNKQNGGRGEVTEQLALLLKSLWSLQYDPEISVRFKSLVDKHASQYKGGSQHDAQEFLLWLLDQVHEDLNTATKRKYKPVGLSANASNDGSTGNEVDSSDEILAAESLANYARCNNSFVMDVFQAQFRSSLTCPKCEKQSNTFDPFLCVSLPIPQKQLVPVFVVVLYIDQSPRQVKIGLTMGVDETVGDLRKTLSKDTGIEEGQLLLTEIDGLKFRRTLRDEQPVTVLKRSEPQPAKAAAASEEKKRASRYESKSELDQAVNLYAIEVPRMKYASEDDGAYVVLTWINVLKEGPIERRFGSPYTIQITREALYSDLQKLLMKEMAPILHEDILISAQKVPLFKIRVVDDLENFEKAGDGDKDQQPSVGTYLDAKVEMPMYTEAVEQAMNLCSLNGPASGPAHVKLVLEWDAPAKSQVILDDEDVIEEHASVAEVAKCPEEATSVSLQECFSLYTSAEKLGVGDAWLCPALSPFHDRTMATLSITRANSGIFSVMNVPGTLVLVGFHGPRIPEGASGFGSQDSK